MKKLFIIFYLFSFGYSFCQQQTINNGESGTVVRNKINSNFTELYSRSNWNTSGSTTVTSPTITGNVTFSGDQTFSGKIIGTKTETSIADSRPVVIPLTYLVQPSSAPGSSVDYHGIDISVSSSGNTNTNTRLYPVEITTGHSGTGTLGRMVNLYTNSRNTSSGTVEDITQIRQRITNSGGGTITNVYCRQVDTPVNSSGTIVNFYADYINNVTAGSTSNWGYYSLMPSNFLEGVKIGSTGISVEDGANSTLGRATLVAGTVTVNTNKVTANSNIFVTIQTNGGTIGTHYVSARSAGTSFTITSTSNTDTSTISWFIVEPY